MKKSIDLKKYIRDIQDYPKTGVMFRDITPLLQDPLARHYAIMSMEEAVIKNKFQPDVIAGIEARGFIFGSVLAQQMRLPLVPIRKKGKLPYTTVSWSYDLEYGKDTIEMHEDAIKKGERVLIVDDVLATGGTALAAAKLVESLKGEPSFCFLIELDYLRGREQISGYPIASVVHYE